MPLAKWAISLIVVGAVVVTAGAGIGIYYGTRDIKCDDCEAGFYHADPYSCECTACTTSTAQCTSPIQYRATCQDYQDSICINCPLTVGSSSDICPVGTHLYDATND